MSTFLPIGIALASAPIAVWADARVASRAALVPASAGAETPHQRIRSIPHRPFVVALIAALAAAGVAHEAGRSWLLPAQVIAAVGLCVLALCDVEWLLLPKVPVWTITGGCGAAILAGAMATGAWHRFWVAVLSAVVVSALFAVVSFINPRWLGFGDVRLAVPIGMVLGWSGGSREVLAGIFLVNVLTLVVALALLVSGRIGRQGALPFGALLAGGTIAALLIG